MPNKTEEYLALACKTADSFSRQWEHWAEFLITAARLYKYSYPDQLMIYAQRPDATACAEYDVWNNKMNRYVRRGSKGIALLDESGGFPTFLRSSENTMSGVRSKNPISRRQLVPHLQWNRPMNCCFILRPQFGQTRLLAPIAPPFNIKVQLQ